MEDLRTAYKPGVTGDGPLMALCPWHGDQNPSLAIYANGVHCFGCGKSAQSSSFVIAHPPGTVNIRYQSKGRSGSASQKQVYLPMSLVDTYHRWLMTGRFAHRKKWLYDRGITDETILRLKLGHAMSSFVIPVCDVLGRLRQVRYRRDDAYNDDDSGPKYWGVSQANQPTFFLGSNLSPGGVVYLCEGELDAARLSQEGLLALSATNGAKSLTPAMATALRLPQIVYICYDQDPAGCAGAERVRAMIGDKAHIVSWNIQNGKDVTDFIQTAGLAAFEQSVKESR